MNSTKIFYFSGTGNSYIVAKEISSGLKCESIPIQKFNNLETVDIDADKIGLVFPAFYMRIPQKEKILNEYV
jgi:flavodoxin